MIDEPTENPTKTRGSPRKGDRFSHFDKRSRRHEIMKLHLEGVPHAEIQVYIEEKYNLSPATIRDDIRAVERRLEAKMEENEEQWIKVAIEEFKLELETLMTEATAAESDSGRSAFRKLLLENRKYLFENFLLKNYFKNLKAAQREASREEFFNAYMNYAENFQKQINGEEDDSGEQVE